MNLWQTSFNRCQIANARNVKPEANNNGCNNPNTGKRGRQNFGNPRHHPNYTHRQDYKRKHQIERLTAQPFTARCPRTGRIGRFRDFELGHLCQKNYNGQPIHKAQHYRMRHQANKAPPLHHSGKHLQHPHEDHCGKQIFYTVLSHQSHHNYRQSSGGPRDHARAPTNERSDKSDHKCRIKSDKRVHSCNKCKCNGLWHQCQRNGQT